MIAPTVFLPKPPPHDKTKWFAATVHIEDTKTGEVRQYKHDCEIWDTQWEGEPGWSDSNWREGNSSCDCNRADYFGATDGDWTCGTKRFRVVKLVCDETGETLYSELS